MSMHFKKPATDENIFRVEINMGFVWQNQWPNEIKVSFQLG